jgi:hypothetical protein
MRFRRRNCLNMRADCCPFYCPLPSCALCTCSRSTLDVSLTDGPDFLPANVSSAGLKYKPFALNICPYSRTWWTIQSACKPRSCLCGDPCAVFSVLEPGDQSLALLMQSSVNPVVASPTPLFYSTVVRFYNYRLRQRSSYGKGLLWRVLYCRPNHVLHRKGQCPYCKIKLARGRHQLDIYLGNALSS